MRPPRRQPSNRPINLAYDRAVQTLRSGLAEWWLELGRHQLPQLAAIPLSTAMPLADSLARFYLFVASQDPTIQRGVRELKRAMSALDEVAVGLPVDQPEWCDDEVPPF